MKKFVQIHGRELETAQTGPKGLSTVSSPGAMIGESPIHDALQVPQQIGRYRIERFLGKGGFGQVFLAHDDDLRRPVAIKVPHRERVAGPKDLELYLTEARVVASLDHPHIVPVYDVGRGEDGLPFVVAKFIEGHDLSTQMKASRSAFGQAAQLVATIAEALHYAHSRGLVHRDVKPSNILLDLRGEPFLADFGLALHERDFGQRQEFAGTPAYMSPEQARGEGHRVDGRSDVFSLGVVFYELLTGRRPFQGSTLEALLEQITLVDVRPPRQVDDTIPKELERICLKALSKRASERYTTARDLGEDVRHFLAQTANQSRSPLWQVPQESSVTAGPTPKSPALATPPVLSDGQPVAMIPKGLRSFDAHDADFYVNLLPGPRDREGLPESIRFWKSRIEARDADHAFSVGLIYGPSGCGKSSLVKAGLLPRLADHVVVVYLEATSTETEVQLLKSLRKHCRDLTADLGLSQSVAAIRRGCGIPAGKKLLIVLDQFEQWLHAPGTRQDPALVQALRQCDGERVQCLVLVRDDFWMAVTQFMRELEIRIIEGQNSAVVELFDLDHARRVLAALGRAFGRYSENHRGAIDEQNQFLDLAIEGLAQEGKIICVRLALFAEMMKGKPWTPATLRAMGGTSGIGVTFLEETFRSPSAPPEHRRNQKAASAVLQALLPDTGGDIKGHVRTYAELLLLSGYAQRPRDFAALLDILDGETRLITPTELPEAELESHQAVQPGDRLYQLTHDYLVPSLREWLARRQKETRRGQAELRLVERSTLWNARPENRHLPSLGEYLRICLLTTSRNWTTAQRAMMSTAGRVHALRLVVATLMLLAALIGAREIAGRSQAATLVKQLATADTALVPGLVQQVESCRRWAAPLLEQKQSRAAQGSREKLHMALARLPADPRQVEFLREQLTQIAPNQFPAVRDSLRPHQRVIVEPLWQAALDSQRPIPQRFQAACALASYAPADARWNQVNGLAASHLVSRPASDFLAWREALRPAKDRFLEPLAAICRNRSEREQIRIYATETLSEYASDNPPALFDLLADAEAIQFSILFDKLAAHHDEAVKLAQAELNQERVGIASDERKEIAARRQTNAAATLLRLGHSEPVWPLLRHTPDPRVRSYLIDRAARLDVAPQTIIQRLDHERDVSARRALLQGLGVFSERQFPAPDRAALLPRLLDLYKNDADPGIHSCAAWLLRQWGRADSLKSIDQTLATGTIEGDRRWYVTGQEQTLTIISGPVEFFMGSPPSELWREGSVEGRLETRHKRRIGRTFAVGTTEVTLEQFLRFRSDHSYNRQSAPSATCPVHMVTWYDAAEYCNWLSKQEGIPPEQWCYVPNGEGKYADGMQLKPDYLSLSGYRLPSEAEWEYACRAGASTARYFGESDELIGTYAWCSKVSQDHQTLPVGSLLPNDLGMFDMLGNVWEWSQDLTHPFGEAEMEDVAYSGPVSDAPRLVRGGAFTSHSGVLRAAKRQVNPPKSRLNSIGFRVARTIH